MNGAGRAAGAARSCGWRQDARGQADPSARAGGPGGSPERLALLLCRGPVGQCHPSAPLPSAGTWPFRADGTCLFSQWRPPRPPEFAARGPSPVPHWHSRAVRTSERMRVRLSSAAATKCVCSAADGRRGALLASLAAGGVSSGGRGSTGTPARLTHLLCPPRAGRGQGALAFSHKGITGGPAARLTTSHHATAGTVFQHKHLGDTNVQCNTAGEGRMGRPDSGHPSLGKRALGNCPKRA